MYNGYLDVSVKYDFALLASEAHDILGHGNHAFSEQVDVGLGFFEVIGMIAASVVDDFASLCKPWLVATIQQTLESHISVHLFQMTLGILHVLIAKVTAVFVFDTFKVLSLIHI